MQQGKDILFGNTHIFSNQRQIRKRDVLIDVSFQLEHKNEFCIGKPDPFVILQQKIWNQRLARFDPFG
jgi:hypothetical protein